MQQLKSGRSKWWTSCHRLRCINGDGMYRKRHFLITSHGMCPENGGFLSQGSAEGLVQQELLQGVEGGELALVG
jgi:hypothetical protein